MDTTLLQQLQAEITQANSIGIAVRSNPSIDEMGAALALYLALKADNKAVSIASPTETIVALSHLVGIDKVTTQFAAGTDGDLIVSFPYREGEIEKVSYTIDDEKNLLNIVVKAGEAGLNFSDKDVVFARGGGKMDLLVTVGIADLRDIQKIFDATAQAETRIVNIDNSTDNTQYGDVTLLATQYSSLCEQMTQVISDLRLSMDIDIAQNLLYGLSAATSNFQSPRTSAYAFETAAMLMKQGAVRGRNTGNSARDEQTIRNEMRQSFDKVQDEQPQKQVNNDTQAMQQQPSKRFNNSIEAGQRDLGPDLNPPSDWLTPKVYKGSTNV